MSTLRNFRERRFTLVEVIVVVIIISILAVITMSNAPGIDEDLIAESDAVVANLRFAQSMSMKDDENTWGITFSQGSYELQLNGASQTIAGFPNTSAPTYALLSNINASGSVEFDEWGKPVGGADVSINISKGGSDPLIVTINSNGEIK